MVFVFGYGRYSGLTMRRSQVSLYDGRPAAHAASRPRYLGPVVLAPRSQCPRPAHTGLGHRELHADSHRPDHRQATADTAAACGRLGRAEAMRHAARIGQGLIAWVVHGRATRLGVQLHASVREALVGQQHSTHPQRCTLILTQLHSTVRAMETSSFHRTILPESASSIANAA